MKGETKRTYKKIWQCMLLSSFTLRDWLQSEVQPLPAYRGTRSEQGNGNIADIGGC
jgi:hypothetical protein